MKTRCTLPLRERNQKQLTLAFTTQHIECVCRDIGRRLNLSDTADRNLAVLHFIHSPRGAYFQSHVTQV